ncbi:uncharacterized protein METZ01_LOCUS461291, partial [marine metagenome]
RGLPPLAKRREEFWICPYPNQLKKNEKIGLPRRGLSGLIAAEEPEENLI